MANVKHGPAHLRRRNPDGTKTCAGPCGMDLPANSVYFDRDETKEDGLRTVCKVCRSKERELAKQDKIDKRVKAMDEASLALLKNISKGGSQIPHVSELYERVMEAFEGAGGFAAHFMAQYLMAQPGSTTRTKMLELAIRLGIITTQQGASQEPIDVMEDEDLQVAFRRYATRFIKQVPQHEHGDAKEAS